MHLIGVQRIGSTLFIRFLSRLAFHMKQLQSLGIGSERHQSEPLR